jgi:hypothetical protein
VDRVIIPERGGQKLLLALKYPFEIRLGFNDKIFPDIVGK